MKNTTSSTDFPFSVNVNDVLRMEKDELLRHLQRLHDEYLLTISQTSKLSNIQSHVITMAHKVAVLKQRCNA